MKVSVIGGTGPQGLGIAERLAIAGIDVIVGSRKEEKAKEVNFLLFFGVLFMCF